MEKSRLATQELKHYCEKENVDVACIQEPYTNNGKMLGMPIDVMVLLPEDPNHMVAAIMFNRRIEENSKNTIKWIQSFDLKLGPRQVTTVNVYCQS